MACLSSGRMGITPNATIEGLRRRLNDEGRGLRNGSLPGEARTQDNVHGISKSLIQLMQACCSSVVLQSELYVVGQF